MKSILATSALLTTTVALTLTSKTYTAKYEIDQGSSINFVNLSAPYDGLLYQGFRNGPFDEQAGDCAYVCAVSFPGTAAFTASPGALANVTTNYPGSKAKYVTLSDFYFGCNAQFTNVSDPATGQHIPWESPNNCTLHVAGYVLPNTPAVAKQTFHYQPQIRGNRNTGAPAANMGHYTFNTAFQVPGITFVKFTAEGSNVGYIYESGGQVLGPYAAGVPDVLVDDFTYTVYS